MGTYTKTTHGEVNAHFAFKGANYRVAKIVVKDNRQLGYSEYFIGNIEKEGSKFIAIANKQGFIGEYKTLAAAAQALADAHFAAPVAVVEPIAAAVDTVAPVAQIDSIETVIATEVVIEEMCELANKAGATPEQMMEWAKSPEGLQILAARILQIAGLTPPPVETVAPIAQPVAVETPADLEKIYTHAAHIAKSASTFLSETQKAQVEKMLFDCAYASTCEEANNAADNLFKICALAKMAQNNAQTPAEVETVAPVAQPETPATPVAIIEGGKDYTGVNLAATITVKKSIKGQPDGTAIVTTADGAVEVLPARTESAQAQPDAEAQFQAAETAARERRDEAIAFAEQRLTEKYEAEKSTAMLICTLSTSKCKFQNLDAALRSIEAAYAAEYKRAHADAQVQYDADIEKARSTLRAARIEQMRCKNTACKDCGACAKQTADAARKERIEAVEWAAEGAAQAQAQIQLTPALLALNEQANKFYNFNKITEAIADLNRNGSTQVGYLASCGSTHATQKVFRLWERAVKQIAKQGFILIKEDIKQRNAYATTNGGFRMEIKYTISK